MFRHSLIWPGTMPALRSLSSGGMVIIAATTPNLVRFDDQ
jgi:hypothetical protein